MPIATRSMNNPAILEAHAPLAARIARSVVAVSAQDLPAEVMDKVKLCLVDLIGCAFESRDLPWSRQAVQLAEHVDGKIGGATIIGLPGAFACGDAALANAVMGHRKNASLLIVQWQKGVPITVYPAKDAISPPLWPKQ